MAESTARPQMTTETIAENAIGLFLEYRDKHGNTEDMTLMNACREVIEGTEDLVVVDKQSHDALTAQNAELREALEGLAFWTYADSSRCWCTGGHPIRPDAVHSTLCTKARAALAKGGE